MLNKLSTVPFSIREVNHSINSDLIEFGPKFPKSDIIKLFSFQQWEDFIWEWSTSLIPEKYVAVEKCSGAGDKGRDVVAYISEQSEEAIYDNFQCKHYDHPLHPGDIWLELGKLCYYSFIKAYSVPRKYYFVAPRGIGTSVSQLLKKPQELKNQLLKNWNGKCRANISKGSSISLDGAFLEYVETFDFKIIEGLNILNVIKQHENTNWHATRFGGGLPSRPSSGPVPTEIQVLENNYISQLFHAYSEREKYQITSVEDLNKSQDLQQHFFRAREQFYSAEALRVFSRDALPPAEYDNLQHEFFHGIIDTVMLTYPHGYERILKTVKQAMNLTITHPLQKRMTTIDRGGVCHQLVNEERFKWVDGS